MNKEIKQKGAIIGVVAIVLLVGVPWFLTYGDQYLRNETPTDRAIALLENGIDTSNSLFTAGENRAFEEEINISLDEFNRGQTISHEKALELARIMDDLKDNQRALDFYDLALELGSEDFLIRVHKGDIYLEMSNPVKAAEEYEIAKVKFPSLYEIYIGQAQAYKAISGTPQYVVDDVYRQGLEEIPGQYELYEAFIDWLEETDREKETIRYYEIINTINPQPLLEQRINELKTKYPS